MGWPEKAVPKGIPGTSERMFAIETTTLRAVGYATAYKREISLREVLLFSC